MKFFTLKTRIILPLMVAVAVLCGVGSYLVINLENRHQHNSLVHDAGSLRSHLQSMLQTKSEVMGVSLRFIAQDKQIISALAAGDRQALLALSAPIYAQLHQENNITHFYFHDAKRVNLLRVHQPERYGDVIARHTALGAEKSGALFSGIELGPLGTFTLRSVLPVFHSGKLAGYIELGQEIDALINESHTIFHMELFTLVQKPYLVQTSWEAGMRMLKRPFDWTMLPDAVLVAKTIQDVPIELLSQVTHSDSSIKVHPNIDMQGLRYWAASFSVDDAAGRPVATLVLLQDMTQLNEQSKADVRFFVSILVVISLIILVFFFVVLGRIERRLVQSQQKIMEEEERFEKISESAQDAIITMDNDGNIAFWNQAAETIFGYTQAEVLGKNLHELIAPKRFHEAQSRSFPLFRETGQGAAIGKTRELVAVHRSGAEFPVELALSASLIAGKWNGIGVLRDISARKKAEHEIEQSLNIQRVLESLLNISLPPLTMKDVLSRSLDQILSIPDFALVNMGSIFLVANGENALAIVAQRNLPDELLDSCTMLPFGKSLCGKAASTREIVFANNINDQYEMSHGRIPPLGQYCVPIVAAGKLLGVLNVYVQAGHVGDETETKYIKTVADTLAVVIERKQTEEALRKLAHNDPLTGLPNRSLFYDRLEQALAWAQRHRQEMAVMFLDLDHFKEVNDTLGHDMGDALLKETSVRLLACVRKMDTVARMGGDEFTVIITEMKSIEDAEHVAKSILEALLEPFVLDGKPCKVGCSIGIASYPKHGRDSETLLKHADTAMYQAKIERNTYRIFSDDLSRDFAVTRDGALR